MQVVKVAEVNVFDLLHPPKEWGIVPPDELVELYRDMPEHIQKACTLTIWGRPGCPDIRHMYPRGPLAFPLGQ